MVPLRYFRQKLMVARCWFNDQTYGDIVGLCQFWPGPANSQVGMAIGLARAGIGGTIASCLGFSLPSVIALVLFAAILSDFGAHFHGLQVVAVAMLAST